MTVEETIEVLRGLRPRYEEHHRVEITDEAITAAAKLAKRYVADRFLPDKAIDLLDEAVDRATAVVREKAEKVGGTTAWSGGGNPPPPPQAAVRPRCRVGALTAASGGRPAADAAA